VDVLKKLPQEVQLLLGGGVLYLIFSFLDWQQVSLPVVGSVGASEWHGVGVIAGLLAIALIAWEGARALGYEIPGAPAGLVSVGVALLLLLFTVITVLSHNDARHWPAWVGLLLSIGIAAVAVPRARTEGVQMPELGGLADRIEQTSARRTAAKPPDDEPESHPAAPED
jgi:hypothetical protein